MCTVTFSGHTCACESSPTSVRAYRDAGYCSVVAANKRKSRSVGYLLLFWQLTRLLRKAQCQPNPSSGFWSCKTEHTNVTAWTSCFIQVEYFLVIRGVFPHCHCSWFYRFASIKRKPKKASLCSRTPHIVVLL